MKKNIVFGIIFFCLIMGVNANTYFTGNLQINGQDAETGTTMDVNGTGLLEGTELGSTVIRPPDGDYNLALNYDFLVDEDEFTFIIQTPGMLNPLIETRLVDKSGLAGEGEELDPYILDLEFTTAILEVTEVRVKEGNRTAISAQEGFNSTIIQVLVTNIGNQDANTEDLTFEGSSPINIFAGPTEVTDDFTINRIDGNSSVQVGESAIFEFEITANPGLEEDGEMNINALIYYKEGGETNEIIQEPATKFEDDVFIVDLTAPTTTDDVPAEWQTADFDITLTCNDAGAGCQTTYYCIDESNTCNPTNTYSGPVSVTCEAGQTCIQYVRYYSIDAVGNVETVKSTGQIRIDKKNPTVETLYINPIYSNAENYIPQTITITAAVEDNGSGIDDQSCGYTLNGTDWFSAIYADGNCTATVADTTGATSINMRVRDWAKNETEGTPVTVTVDTTGPTVTVDTPEDGKYYSPLTAEDSLPSGRVADNAGGVGLNADSTEFYLKALDGEHAGKYWNENDENWSVDTYWFATEHNATTGGEEVEWNAAFQEGKDQPESDEGNYEIMARATDKLGNTSDSEPITFAFEEEEEEADPSPTPPPGGGGVGGGGGLPGPTPTPTPTPEPTPTPTPTPEPTPTPSETREVVRELREEHRPSEEELRQVLEEAGFLPEFIEKALEDIEQISIVKEITVYKITDQETGEERFESIITITIKNTSENALEEVKIVENIPKEIAETADLIYSETSFTVLKENPIIMWTIDRLAPGQEKTLEYKVLKEVQEEEFSETSTIAAFEREIEEPGVTMTVQIKNIEGQIIEERFEVTLIKEMHTIIEEKTTVDGETQFTGLMPGEYIIIVSETPRYQSMSKEIEIGLESKTVDILLEEKEVIPVTPPEEARPGYWILIILIILGCGAYAAYYYSIKPKGVRRKERKHKEKHKKKPKRKLRKKHKKKPKKEEKEEEEKEEGEEGKEESEEEKETEGKEDEEIEEEREEGEEKEGEKEEEGKEAEEEEKEGEEERKEKEKAGETDEEEFRRPFADRNKE